MKFLVLASTWVGNLVYEAGGLYIMLEILNDG